eukprot:bmy_20207T0
MLGQGTYVCRAAWGGWGRAPEIRPPPWGPRAAPRENRAQSALPLWALQRPGSQTRPPESAWLGEGLTTVCEPQGGQVLSQPRWGGRLAARDLRGLLGPGRWDETSAGPGTDGTESPALTLLLEDEACWLRTLPRALTEAEANSEIYRKGWYPGASLTAFRRVGVTAPPGPALKGKPACLGWAEGLATAATTRPAPPLMLA